DLLQLLDGEGLDLGLLGRLLDRCRLGLGLGLLAGYMVTLRIEAGQVPEVEGGHLVGADQLTVFIGHAVFHPFSTGIQGRLSPRGRGSYRSGPGLAARRFYRSCCLPSAQYGHRGAAIAPGSGLLRRDGRAGPPVGAATPRRLACKARPSQTTTPQPSLRSSPPIPSRQARSPPHRPCAGRW